jgi:glycerol uptake facilitator-like aquaporin
MIVATSSVMISGRRWPHSPGGYNLISCLVIEVMLTFMLLIIILGATDGRTPAGERRHFDCQFSPSVGRDRTPAVRAKKRAVSG